MLRPAQVGDMFDRAMREDKDGAVYCLYPGGLPVVEMPYTEAAVLRNSIWVASLLTKLGLSGEGQLVTPLQIGAVLGGAAVAALWLFQLMFCWLLF